MVACYPHQITICVTGTNQSESQFVTYLMNINDVDLITTCFDSCFYELTYSV